MTISEVRIQSLIIVFKKILSLLNDSFIYPIVLSSLLAPMVHANDSTSEIGELYKQTSLTKLISIKAITVSKKEEFTQDAPGIVTVFSKKEIEMFGAIDLWDLLGKIPGVMTVNTTMSNAIQMRGDKVNLSATHVLILLDGTPISRDGYDGGIWNGVIYSSFPIEAIEQVEVIRGPGSVLYGTNAFSGVVNIITKTAVQDDAEAAFTMGSFDTYGIDFFSSFKKLNGLRVTTALSFLDTDGSPYDAVGIDSISFAHKNFQRNRLGIHSRAEYKGFHLNTSLTSIYKYQLNGTQSTHETTNDIDKYFIDAGYTYDINNKWSLSGKYSYIRTETEIPVTQIASAPIFNYNFDDKIAEATVKGAVTEKIDVIVGGVYSMFNGTSSSVSEWSFNWKSIYAATDYQVKDFLKLNIGGQYHDAGNNSTKFVPRAGVISKVGPNFGVKILYGQAFRAPYSVEKEVVLSFILGNPDLKPELITTYDLQLFFENTFFHASLTGFHSVQENLIERVPITHDSTLQANYQNMFQNHGELTINGLEAESKITPNDHIYISGSFNYQINEDAAGFENYSLAPNYFFKWGLGFNNNFITSGIYAIHNSAFYGNSHYKSPVTVASSTKTESMTNLSANVLIRLNKVVPILTFPDIRLQLYVSNILDQQYYVSDVLSQLDNRPSMPGRAFYIKLKCAL